MTTYLFDANVLIALTVVEHEHHERTSTWSAGIERFAVCPMVEGALVRFLIRIGESARVAQDLLRAVHAVPGCEFWPDSPSYVTTDLGEVRGHRQVTDAYLVGLAAARTDAFVATLGQGLVQSWPDRTVLIPHLG